jgi:hypothetical protein
LFGKKEEATVHNSVAGDTMVETRDLEDLRGRREAQGGECQRAETLLALASLPGGGRRETWRATGSILEPG